MLDIVISFDGLCEPVNPGGYACFGYVIYFNKSKFVGCGNLGNGKHATNNIAEWAALKYALDRTLTVWEKDFDSKIIESLTIIGDSKLVINQMTGRYQIKNDLMKKIRNYCVNKLDKLNVRDNNVSVRWTPRDFNFQADEASRLGYLYASCTDESLRELQ